MIYLASQRGVTQVGERLIGIAIAGFVGLGLIYGVQGYDSASNVDVAAMSAQISAKNVGARARIQCQFSTSAAAAAGGSSNASSYATPSPVTVHSPDPRYIPPALTVSGATDPSTSALVITATDGATEHDSFKLPCVAEAPPQGAVQ